MKIALSISQWCRKGESCVRMRREALCMSRSRKAPRTLLVFLMCVGAVFSIATKPVWAGTPTPPYEMNGYPAVRPVCAGGAVDFVLDAVPVRLPSDPVALSVDSGLPPGTTVSFSTNPLVPPALVVATLQTGATPAGEYPITFVGVAPTFTEFSTVVLRVFGGPPSVPVLSEPADGATGLALSPQFTWTGLPTALYYDLEIATDSGVTNIVNGLYDTKLPSVRALGRLNPLTTYYWRVRGFNGCGNGPYSTVRSFTTGQFDCNMNDVDDLFDVLGRRMIENVTNNLNLAIPDCVGVDVPGTSHSLNITDCAPVVDLDVSLHITHTYVGDLVVTLTHDQTGTSAVLMSRIGFAEVDPRCSAGECCGNSSGNVDVRFDDDLLGSIEGAILAQGPFSPFPGALSVFDGESACGSWTIAVTDNANGDTGVLDGWGVHFSVATPQSLDCDYNGVPDECDRDLDSDGLIDACDDDIDGDGIPNARDACFFTPIGTVPDASGTFAADLDDDCDVDLRDFNILQQQLTGPSQ